MMSVSVWLEPRGEHDPPSAKTSDIGGWRRHRQECQFVRFAGRHNSCGDGELALIVKGGSEERVSRVTLLFIGNGQFGLIFWLIKSPASCLQQLALFFLRARLAIVDESFEPWYG